MQANKHYRTYPCAHTYMWVCLCVLCATQVLHKLPQIQICHLTLVGGKRKQEVERKWRPSSLSAVCHTCGTYATPLCMRILQNLRVYLHTCGFLFSTIAAGFPFASFCHLLQQLCACCFLCFLLSWVAHLSVVVVCRLLATQMHTYICF